MRKVKLVSMSLLFVILFVFSSTADWVPSAGTKLITKVSCGLDYNDGITYRYFLQLENDGTYYVLPNKEMAAIAMAKVANNQGVRVLATSGSWTINGMGTLVNKVITID